MIFFHHWNYFRSEFCKPMWQVQCTTPYFTTETVFGQIGATYWRFIFNAFKTTPLSFKNMPSARAMVWIFTGAYLIFKTIGCLRKAMINSLSSINQACKKMTRQQILRYAERVLLIQNYNNFYISQIFLSCFLVQTWYPHLTLESCVSLWFDTIVPNRFKKIDLCG